MRDKRPLTGCAPEQGMTLSIISRSPVPSPIYTTSENSVRTLLNMSAAANRMAAKVAESATKVAGKAGQSGSSGGAKKGQQNVLQKGAKRDPELYVWNRD